LAKKIPARNQSPTGWWIASYIERASWNDEKRPSAGTRCYAWENTIILKARDREAAYAKAIKLASSNKSNFSDEKGKRAGRWDFMGLTDLLPLYEPIADGSEIFWEEHSRTFETLKRKVKSKRQLGVFDDKPAMGDIRG